MGNREVVYHKNSFLYELTTVVIWIVLLAICASPWIVLLWLL